MTLTPIRRLFQFVEPFQNTALLDVVSMWTCVCLQLMNSGTASAEDAVIRFEDVTSASQLATHLEKRPATRPWRYAHGAAWGDIDNDGRPDLYVGAFAGRARDQNPLHSRRQCFEVRVEAASIRLAGRLEMGKDRTPKTRNPFRKLLCLKSPALGCVFVHGDNSVGKSLVARLNG